MRKTIAALLACVAFAGVANADGYLAENLMAPKGGGYRVTPGIKANKNTTLTCAIVFGIATDARERLSTQENIRYQTLWANAFHHGMNSGYFYNETGFSSAINSEVEAYRVRRDIDRAPYTELLELCTMVFDK